MSEVATRLRQCASCRQAFPRNTMLRVTWCREGNQFSLDNNPPLQGRSAYVCNRPTCLQEAIKAKRVQRALKTTLPDVIVDSLKARLAQLEAAG